MYQDGEANLAVKLREVSLSLLIDGMVDNAVPSSPVITPLVASLSEWEVFVESEGRRNCRSGNYMSTFVPKRPGLLVILQRLGRLVRG